MLIIINTMWVEDVCITSRNVQNRTYFLRQFLQNFQLGFLFLRLL